MEQARSYDPLHHLRCDHLDADGQPLHTRPATLLTFVTLRARGAMADAAGADNPLGSSLPRGEVDTGRALPALKGETVVPRRLDEGFSGDSGFGSHRATETAGYSGGAAATRQRVNAVDDDATIAHASPKNPEKLALAAEKQRRLREAVAGCSADAQRLFAMLEDHDEPGSLQPRSADQAQTLGWSERRYARAVNELRRALAEAGLKPRRQSKVEVTYPTPEERKAIWARQPGSWEGPADTGSLQGEAHVAELHQQRVATAPG